jgi:hypothetical protein
MQPATSWLKLVVENPRALAGLLLIQVIFKKFELRAA